ncbi:hypothetical protein EYC84_004076 [Monilinia fructicola]|uniref:Uncharacterized protein n=1 Tax=Monilinia fructicola TaxID=38448 RepID=A0A5M9K000_MONFR|nr:hypothetical protein EYC84_004076 [Monilinia fructicola]
MRFFGQPFGLTSSGSDLHSLIAAAQTGGNVIHSLARLPWLKKQIFSSRLGKRYLAPRPNDGSPIGEVINMREVLINQRINEGKAKKAHSFIHEAKNPDGTNTTPEKIKEDVLFFLLAGYETLGHTLRSVITHVASHRSVKCRLWSEISGTPVTTDIISSKHALTLPSLQATIRENLRYDPAICSHLPRFPSRSKYLEILGYVVPASVELACDVNPSTGAKRQLAVMRMCFDQRYLENDDAEQVVFEFFRRFDVELVDDGIRKAYVTPSVKGVKIKLENRIPA